MWCGAVGAVTGGVPWIGGTQLGGGLVGCPDSGGGGAQLDERAGRIAVCVAGCGWGAAVGYGGLRIISWRSAHSGGYSALSGMGRGGARPRDRWRSPIMLIVYW